MALGEFELIHSYFSSLGGRRSDVRLGIGDDCALLSVPQGMQLAVTMDTLVSGVHFLPDVDPEALGHKALAVNLSDLAAMGAEPAWFSLALTLPDSDSRWLADFSRGMGRLAAVHAVQLIGGDTTRGPLSITIQAQGFLPTGQGLLRSGAEVGDLIYVTGALGDAGLALSYLQQGLPAGELDPGLIRRLERPEPRLGAGMLCGKSPLPPSIFPTGCSRTSGISCRPAGWGRRSIWIRFHSQLRFERRSRRSLTGRYHSLPGMIMNCALPCRRHRQRR